MVEFSDEEGYGKYLDLHECYEKYINLKGIEVIIIYCIFFAINYKCCVFLESWLYNLPRYFWPIIRHCKGTQIRGIPQIFSGVGWLSSKLCLSGQTSNGYWFRNARCERYYGESVGGWNVSRMAGKLI